MTGRNGNRTEAQVDILAGGGRVDTAEEMLSLAELAGYLGKSRQTIYQWRSRGCFPFKTHGTGKKLRVARQEVDTYLSSKGKSPASGPRMPVRRPGLAAAPAPRRVVQSVHSGVPLELALVRSTQLSEVAAFIERVKKGAEVSIVLGEEGCLMRVD